MGKNKLGKFAENKTFKHVFQPTAEESLNEDYKNKGNWRKNYFNNENPIILEVGCGKGEYSVGLGKQFKDKNFIGIDIKGARIWRGAKTVEEENIKNVAFLRTRAEFIERFFGKDEIDEIWITFADPQPKKDKKRLTSPRFIEHYRNILKKGGIMHLKTDSDILYEYTMEQIEEHGYELIQQTDNLYSELIDDLDEETQKILNIKTHYEKLFSDKGFDIKYVKFKIS